MSAPSSIASAPVLQADQGLGSQSSALLSRLENGGPPRLQSASPPWTQRIRGAVSGFLLGALVFSGCTFNPGGLDPLDATSGGDSGTMADGGDGGTGGDGGMDAGTMPTAPSVLRPTMAQMLHPGRAYLRWQDGIIPSGRTITDYQLCFTSGAATTIDDATECPGNAMIATPYSALESDTPGATYRFKVRARFDDGSFSPYSDVRTFVTDGGLTGRWKLDGNGTDATGLGHGATPQNGAAFDPSGRVGQALSLAGLDDHATVNDAPAFNVGTGDFTWAAWINPDLSGVFQSLIEKRTSANGFEIYRRPTGGLAFAGHACGEIILANGIVNGEWHRALVTRSGMTVNVFIDGILAGSGTCADDFNNTAHVAFGCNSPERGCSTPLQGRMDEILSLNLSTTAEMAVNDFCADEAAAGVSPPAVCQ
ncbi:MAG TPA: LamG-like jellyroll fold domain-containing protein [bacterium]|nr:LamG-like jellyroll fold domain-containing protein [bacterium]